MSKQIGIPRPTLCRLPLYYRRLLRAIEEGDTVIRSAELGHSADVPGTQVRKDLSYLDEYGRPGIGYDVVSLARRLKEFLGLVNDKEAVVVGAGNLGRALAQYPGFARYGLRIVALFDNDPAKIGEMVGEHEVLPVSKLPDLVRRLHIQIGIIAVPANAAQSAVDTLLAAGVRVIWNFAPRKLEVPDEVLVKNEDLAAELATLSHHISRHSVAQQNPGGDRSS